MSKYEPLRRFLEANGAETVAMSFAQIESLLGFKLPASHRYRAWWSNNTFNNVMTNAWIAAGYKTEQVDIEARKLVFRRVKMPPIRTPGFAEAAPGGLDGAGVVATGSKPRAARRHPLFGWMRGTITIAPGTDLAAPADPDLADYLNRKYGRESGAQPES